MCMFLSPKPCQLRKWRQPVPNTTMWKLEEGYSYFLEPFMFSLGRQFLIQFCTYFSLQFLSTRGPPKGAYVAQGALTSAFNLRGYGWVWNTLSSLMFLFIPMFSDWKSQPCLLIVVNNIICWIPGNMFHMHCHCFNGYHYCFFCFMMAWDFFLIWRVSANVWQDWGVFKGVLFYPRHEIWCEWFKYIIVMYCFICVVHMKNK